MTNNFLVVALNTQFRTIIEQDKIRIGDTKYF